MSAYNRMVGEHKQRGEPIFEKVRHIMHHYDLREALSFASRFCLECVDGGIKSSAQASGLAQQMQMLAHDTQTDNQELNFRKIAAMKIHQTQLQLILRIAKRLLEAKQGVKERVQMDAEERGEALGDDFATSGLNRMTDQLADFVLTLGDYLESRRNDAPPTPDS